MNCNTQCCSLVRGVIKIQEIDTCACDNDGKPMPVGPMIEVGSVSEFTATPAITTFQQTDYTTGAGGTLCRFDQIDSYDLAITMQCGTIGNVLIALSGNQVDSAAAAIIDESQSIPSGLTTFIGEVIYFNFPIDVAAGAPSIELGGVTLVEGVDYELFGDKGIKILSDTNITAGAELLIDYTTIPSTNIQGLTQASKSYSIIIDGEDAQSGQKVFVRFFNVRLSPGDFTFIDTDNLKNISVAGSVLRNTCDTSAANEKSYFDYRVS